jgi:hypothetical protein
MLPPQDQIDLSQEPSFVDIQPGSGGPGVQTSLPVGLYIGPYEPSPNSYNFKGQDLVYGNRLSGSPSIAVPVWIMNIGSAKASLANVELLGTVTNPRLVVP